MTSSAVKPSASQNCLASSTAESRSIETTLSYYVGRNAEKTAAILWHEHEKAAEPERTASDETPPKQSGKTSG
jgi:hypothetical protein